jgi:transglutaminase-like putative cysteine protease
MLIRFGHEISIQCQNPTPVICLLRTRSERKSDIRSLETTVTNPDVETSTYTDLFGNTCLRFVAPPGILTVWGDGTIEDSGLTDPVDWNAQEVPIADLPDDCLVYLLGSRYCETDHLSQIAWDTFGQTAPGWGRVQAICDFVHNHITFNYMNARATRSAFEAYSDRTGVCRDYAHLAIALCRCMNIPARYVNGYLGDIGVPILDPMDFSAWMEVYLGGRWVTFDPRNNKPRIGRIVVAHGRDAADVPLVHSFGPHVLSSFRVWTYDVTGLPLVKPVTS